MSYQLDPDQIAIQEQVRRVAREKVEPRAQEIDRTAEYPEDMFQLLRELGLFTLPFPEEFGGAGSSLSGCLAVEELGRVCYNTAYLLVVQWTSFGAILAGGTDDQKARFLPGLAQGDLRSSISVTESQSGSDVAGIRTRAEPVDGGFRINGGKVWCTGAPVADIVIVAARTPGEGRAAIELFIVERDTPGFKIGRKEEKMGGRGVPSCELFFDDVFVPRENLLGHGGTGFSAVMEAFSVARPVIAARAVGLAQGAVDHAIGFVTNRRTFGQLVSDNQGIRWMLADMTIATEAARNLTYRAARMVDAGVRGHELATAAAIAKCHATDAAMQVAVDAVQLFGASGISADFPINRYMRDAKLLQIVEGTNQIQRNIIGKNLLRGLAPS